MDQQKKKHQEHELAEARTYGGPKLGITDIIQMTKEGINENVIINQIRNTNSVFALSTADLSLLQANNVSPQVVVEMQNHPAGTRVIRERPRRDVYIYEGYAPPPTYGYGYYRY